MFCYYKMSELKLVFEEIVKYLVLIFLLIFGICFGLKMMGVDPKTLGKFAPFIEMGMAITGASWVYEKAEKSGLATAMKKLVGNMKSAAEKAADKAKNIGKDAKEAEGAGKEAKEGGEVLDILKEVGKTHLKP